MFKRAMRPTLEHLATKFPVIALLGPRQSGKTTLARDVFSTYRYFSLEDADTRMIALADPRRFLESNSQVGMILDEFQCVPELLSYMQGIVDRTQRQGQFILTGSQNFLMNEAISQSLAGRVAILTLLPLSLNELQQADVLPATLDGVIFNGGYPRLYANRLKPTELFPQYIQTYVERDVRLLKNVTDLSLFQKFVGLCAGRIGQVLNYTSLGSDCGIDAKTVRAWLSLLEASYIIFIVQPYHGNTSKRLIKSPKLYFYDTGLACSLLAIESERQLANHYLKGGLCESLIMSEVRKTFYNAGRIPRMYFWRDSHGNEIDLLVPQAQDMLALEIKAGQTASASYMRGLELWKKMTGTGGYVIYDGQNIASFLNWRSIGQLGLDRVD